MKNSIVKVSCFYFWSDWTEIKNVEINLDEWAFFEIDYRGRDSWHIIGHKCDKEYNWTTQELSLHQVVSVRDLAKFIATANAYKKSQKCKVSRFNNLHYFGGFYEELTNLFKQIELDKPKEAAE